MSPEFFVSIYEKINKFFFVLRKAIVEEDTINILEFSDILSQITSWLHSQENALAKINKYKIGYPDIIQPILNNINELSYGMRLLHAILKKLMIKYDHKNNDLDKFMVNLVKYPILHENSPSVLNMVKLCTENSYNKIFLKILNSDATTNLAKQEHLRLLKVGLQELYNLFVISSPNYATSQNEMILHLHYIINSFVSAWNKQEIERQKKIDEEKSLFKTKTKLENLNEEEESLKEMKKLFQNFHDKDFSDFQEINLEAITNEDEIEEYSGVITNEDIKFVCKLHCKLMVNFTKNEWLNPKQNKLESEFIEPFLQRYKTYKHLLKKIIHSLDHKVDSSLISSMNLLISVLKSMDEGDNLFLNITSSPTKKAKEKSYDFYRDSKVEEVKTCFHIIESLKKRITELLNEWPNHPTLKSIETLLERIYSFSITSPIPRFLTGLEILLSKCQEWEENAHTSVSLSEYFQNLTMQIIAWRKLELDCWKDSLNKAFERVKDSVSYWWMHLYSTFHQFIFEESNTINSQQIIQIIQEFVENSTLGEFESRLELLFTFHCYAVHLPKKSKTDIIISVLWNLHSYYCQFIDKVDTKIKELRTPIEKKLKDYIKIVRWNDINYWSVKETVEKTHRTLHKYIKEFEIVLKQSVKSCLVHTTMSESTEQVGIWDRPLRHAPSQYHYSLDVSIYMASTKLRKNIGNIDLKINQDTLLNTSDKYFVKSRSLCKDIILDTDYPNIIQNLDSFITEVIETSNQLRNLEVSVFKTKKN